MRCGFCGHTNQPGVKFCSKCGAAFPEVPVEEVNKVDIKSTVSSVTKMAKTMPIKKLLLIIIPVVVLIVAAIIVIPMLIGPSVLMRTDNISIFTDRDEVIISGNNNSRFGIDGTFVSMQRSLDGSKAVILTDYGSSGGTLWFVTTSRVTHVADDVLEYLLADSGNGVAYVTDYDSRNDVATLYLHDTSSGRATRVTEDAMYLGSMWGVSISPNGRSLTFTSDYDRDSREYYGYIRVDGRAPERIGKNTYGVAISNGGRHLYYVRTSDDNVRSLHVRSGNNDNRLISELNHVSIMLNRDYSQAIFQIDDRSFISQSGGERERIGGTNVWRIILPRGAQIGGNSDHTIVYGIRSFANNVIHNNDGLAYMDRNFETSRISSTSDYASLALVSENGRTLLYLNNNGHLSAIDPTRPGAERREIGRDVESFVATNNARTVYFVNSDNELWCAKGNSAAEKVSDDVYAASLAMPFRGNRAFFIVDWSARRNSGELFFSNNGGRRAKVGGGDDVVRVWSTATNIFYRTIDNDVFRSNGNDRFSLFAEDLR
jgi:hypothetical protein